MIANPLNRIVLAFGTVGVLAAMVAAATTPAFGVNAASPAPIAFARNVGPVALSNSNKALVSIKLPAGKWLVTAKMWADSEASQPTTNTVVGCSIFKGSGFLDNSAFNTPKVNGAGGTSAGVNVLTALVNLKSPATITLKCDDFGSHAVAH